MLTTEPGSVSRPAIRVTPSVGDARLYGRLGAVGCTRDTDRFKAFRVGEAHGKYRT